MSVRVVLSVAAAMSAVGAGVAYAKHRLMVPVKPEKATNESEMSLSAHNLTQEVVDAVLRDGQTLVNVNALLKSAFTHDDVTAMLKNHFKAEFTENDAILRSLRGFIVGEVISDPWVAGRLIAMSKEMGEKLIKDPEIYPEKVLALIGEAALVALQTDQFRNDLHSALLQSMIVAFSPRWWSI